jgi:hypothetical protein
MNSHPGINGNAAFSEFAEWPAGFAATNRGFFLRQDS